MPGGLFPDEAANGLDINLMEQGHLQPFYERGNGREALFFYMLWTSVKMFGRSPFSHHLVSALVGIISTILCLLITRKLFSFGASETAVSDKIQAKDNFASTGLQKEVVMLQGGNSPVPVSSGYFAPTIIALLAGFIMATNTWYIVLSRTAFRANLVPLFSSLCLLSLFSIYFAKTRTRQYMWSIVFGASLALGFYTYIAYRIMLPLVGLLVLWPFLTALKTDGFRGVSKKYLPLLAVSIISFIIVIYPLGRYFYQHPEWLAGRSGQVSVFNPDWNHGDLVGTILETSRLSLTAYFMDGDLNWRHNISGLPFLSPVVSPFFALGLLVMFFRALRYTFSPIKQKNKYPHFVLMGWFVSFLVPVITTAEGIPHGLRSIGTIPAVFIITAFGLYKVGSFIWGLVVKYPHGSPRMELLLKQSLKLLLVCFLVAIPVQSYASYFIYAANSAENFYAFRSDLTSVSEYMKEHGNRDNTYLVLDKFSVQTVDYLTTVDGTTSCDREAYFRTAGCIDNPANKPYNQVDPEDSWRDADYIKDGKPIWKHGLVEGDKIVFTESSIFDIKKFKQYHPNTRLETEVRNKFGQAVVAVYIVK